MAMQSGIHDVIDLAATATLMVLCVDNNNEPKAPDSAPTYTVYDPDGNVVQTGTLGASDHNSKTGLRRGTEAMTGARGYVAGETYTVLYEYAVSSTSYSIFQKIRVQ